MIRLYSKSERVLSLRTDTRPLFPCQTPTQPSIGDQGKERTLLHSARHEVKRGFLDLDPTLIRVTVWPLWIDMEFWNYCFWAKTNHSQYCVKTKELEYNENIKEREREIFTLDICLFCSIGKVTLIVFSQINAHVYELVIKRQYFETFNLMWECIETNTFQYSSRNQLYCQETNENSHQRIHLLKPRLRSVYMKCN